MSDLCYACEYPRSACRCFPRYPPKSVPARVKQALEEAIGRREPFDPERVEPGDFFQAAADGVGCCVALLGARDGERFPALIVVGEGMGRRSTAGQRIELVNDLHTRRQRLQRGPPAIAYPIFEPVSR